MNQTFKVLGDLRTSDQVIRLNVPPRDLRHSSKGEKQPIGELWAGRGTYVHEWSHYLQFSATPLGIILSKLRRETFIPLLEAAGLMNDIPMPKATYVNTNELASRNFETYTQTLGIIRKIWNPWPERWFLQAGGTPDHLNHVELTPRGLKVKLDGVNGVFSLPLGTQQVFEAWAWLEEQIHSQFMDVDIDYRPENLIYTWPIHLIIGKMGRSHFESRKLSIFMNMVGLLIAASYYDPFAWSYDPLNKSKIGKLLLSKNTKIARVVYQLFKDYANFHSDLIRETDQEFGVVFENYMTRNGLPKLSESVSELRNAVVDLLDKEEQHLKDVLGSVENDDASFITHPARSEIDQLRVTVKNLDALEGSLYEIITDPYTKANLFDLPLCADFNGRCYEWKFYTDMFNWEERDFDLDYERLYLRQGGYTFVEHIVHQLMFSEHIACYGSPYWYHPIEDCKYIEECLQLRNKVGIEFCKDREWRGLVAGYLIMLANTYANENIPEGIPGLQAAADELRKSSRIHRGR